MNKDEKKYFQLIQENTGYEGNFKQIQENMVLPMIETKRRRSMIFVLESCFSFSLSIIFLICAIYQHIHYIHYIHQGANLDSVSSVKNQSDIFILFYILSGIFFLISLLGILLIYLRFKNSKKRI